MSHVSAASFDHTEPNMAAIVNRVHSDYPKFLMA